jgi:hypothetical protein
VEHFYPPSFAIGIEEFAGSQIQIVGHPVPRF